MSDYTDYYRDVSKLNTLDIYQLCKLFGVQDTSGALHHAIKKLLLGGTRTGQKSRHKDIQEARDTLTRWLELEGIE